MDKIEILNKKETEGDWVFSVKIGEGESATTHAVFLQKEYWRKLTREKINPESLIDKSFKFLLQRESKESILRTFNLREIANYFSEYEDIISS